MLNQLQCEVVFVLPNSANLFNCSASLSTSPAYSIAFVSRADTKKQGKNVRYGFGLAHNKRKHAFLNCPGPVPPILPITRLVADVRVLAARAPYNFESVTILSEQERQYPVKVARHDRPRGCGGGCLSQSKEPPSPTGGDAGSSEEIKRYQVL